MTSRRAHRIGAPGAPVGQGAVGADSHCRCNTRLLKSGSSQITGYVTAVDIASSSAVRRR